MRTDRDQILTEWLVLQSQSGNAAALEQLLRHWYPRFRRFATYRIRSVDADDIVQNTLLAIVRSLGTLREPGAFPAWAFRLLNRRIQDYLRQKCRRDEREVVDSELLARAEASDSGGNETGVARAIARLDHDSSCVVTLHYEIGLNLAEISHALGIPVGTVKSRLHNARLKLRKALLEK